MLPIWFSAETARSVAGTLGVSDDEPLLEGNLPFFEIDATLLPRDRGLERAIGNAWRFARSIEASGSLPGDELPLESLLLRTFAAACRASRLAARRLKKLSAVRVSTRQEIARRLSFAEDLLHARFRTPVSLSELAGVATMSSYHFLRRFEEYYGVTPHRFLTRLRLSHARRLLAQGKRTVKEVAYECGYRSVPSFIHLCVREWGRTPAEFQDD